MAKVIAIWGTSYSGSTLLSYVLGSIPGVKSGGELNRIQKDSQGCNICDDCSVFPEPPLLADTPPEQFYDEAANALGTEILVSSDKNLTHYLHYLQDHHNPKCILIWRTPQESWGSHRHVRHFPGLLRYWAKLYRDAFDFLDARGYPYVSIHHTQFCRYPKATLKALCEWLDISYSSEALQYWNTEHHYVGGNTGPLVNILGLENPRTQKIMEEKGPQRAAFYKENYRVIKSVPPSVRPKRQEKVLRLHPDVWDVTERLRECHVTSLELPKTPKPVLPKVLQLSDPPTPCQRIHVLFNNYINEKNGFFVENVQIPVTHEGTTLPPFDLPVALPENEARGLICHMGGYGAASIVESGVFQDFIMAGFHEGSITSYYRIYEGNLFGFDIYAQMVESLRKKFSIEAKDVLLWGGYRAGAVALYAALKYNYGACVAFQPAIDIIGNLSSIQGFLQADFPEGYSRHAYESRYMALVFRAVREGFLTPQEFKKLVPSLFITSILHRKKKIPNITITYGEQNPLDEKLCFHFRSYAERFPNFKTIVVPTTEHNTTKILRKDIPRILKETRDRELSEDQDSDETGEDIDD